MILNPRKIAALLLAALPAIACAGEPEDALVTAAGTLEEPCSAVSDSGKRIECLRKGRDSGSLYLLGMAYRSGDGVKADQDQALRLLRRASKRGSARASLELARIYRGPRKSERDTDALALQYAKTSCSQKSPDGCTLYGAMLMAEAPEENAEEAAEAFAMASSRGSGEAFLHLGRMSLLGLVTKGKMTAEELFLAAERRGLAEASLRLGEIYRDGLTVPQNYQLAADEFRKAALQGSEEAMNDLGLGSADAMNNLALLYQYGFGVRKDYRMTARLLESAARQGNAQALYNLAIMRIRGQYYDRDEGQAFDLMSEAAKRGHPEAAADLGWMYWNGAGTQVNRRLGCRWWDNAVIAGNDTAKENLRRLCKDVNLSEPAVGRKADGADDEDVRPAPEARNMKKGGNRSRPADKKALRSGS